MAEQTERANQLSGFARRCSAHTTTVTLSAALVIAV
jgi:hypothetical protein